MATSSPGEYKPTKNVVEEETFCCGHKRCPHVKMYEDGSMTISDEGEVIEFDANQAKALRAMLNRNAG